MDLRFFKQNVNYKYKYKYYPHHEETQWIHYGEKLLMTNIKGKKKNLLSWEDFDDQKDIFLKIKEAVLTYMTSQNCPISVKRDQIYISGYGDKCYHMETGSWN